MIHSLTFYIEIWTCFVAVCIFFILIEGTGMGFNELSFLLNSPFFLLIQYPLQFNKSLILNLTFELLGHCMLVWKNFSNGSKEE